MTREERKAVSALKKGLPKIVKPLIKPYGFRMTSGRLFGAALHERFHHQRKELR